MITNEQLIEILQSDIIIDADGTQHWYLDDKRHRIDGPAVVYPDGTQIWYLNGLHHRVNGPAIKYKDGTKEWYLNGWKYSNEDYNKKIAEIV